MAGLEQFRVNHGRVVYVSTVKGAG